MTTTSMDSWHLKNPPQPVPTSEAFHQQNPPKPTPVIWACCQHCIYLHSIPVIYGEYIGLPKHKCQVLSSQKILEKNLDVNPLP